MSTLADLKLLLIKRDHIKSKLSQIEVFVEQFVTGTNSKEIQNRIAEMYRIRDEFENVNIDIMYCEEETEKVGESSAVTQADLSEINIFEKNWYTVLSELQSLFDKNTPITLATTSNQNVVQTPQFNVKLPVIDLPVFSGAHTEWLPFYDAFQSLIHNNSTLDNCQKFHYLKSCLKGEASRAIDSLTISSDNYQSAWSVLQKRYKNPRLIIQGHVQKILNSPEINKCSPESLQNLIDDVTSNLEALRVLTIPVDSWDAFLVTLIMNKLDYQTRREFENTLDSDPLTLAQVIKFLEKKRIVLESLSQNIKQKQLHHLPDINRKKSPQNPVNRSSYSITTKHSCYFCGKPNHFINKSEEFLRLSVSERINEVKKRKFCSNCLRSNHQLSECKASGCNMCHSRDHHTLMHESKPHQSNVNHCTSLSNTQVVLSTAVVLIRDNYGNYRECRVLLDVGSQINILSEYMCKKLNLKTNITNMSISGINDTFNKTMKTTKISLRSVYNSYETSINCCILNKVTSNLPNDSFNKSMLQIPDDINLADPKFNENGPIDLLLGAEPFWGLLCIGRIKIQPNLYLSKTLLGWVVGGGFIGFNEQSQTAICNLATKNNQDDKLNDLLERFWAQEETSTYQNNWTAEEIECEENFANTYSRDPINGRFIVELPFKNNKVNLGDSSRNALRRFLSLEKKFRKDAEYKEIYSKAIKELLQNGYLEEVSVQPDENENVFYLPHSGVFKRDPKNAKIRIVYDGSSKSSNGLSLNDNLMTGPNLQNDLFAILIRFRLHQVVISCDMEKMFLQILISHKHTNFQLLFWRFDELEKIKVFRLTRLVFGLTNSPYTAIRCVQQLAADMVTQFPDASRVLQRDRFMDDILSGANDTVKAVELRDQLINILNSGGFKLTKWNSNNPSILSNSGTLDTKEMVNLNKGETAKVLGLWWDPALDVLNYRVEEQQTATDLTKRSILSSIAKIYDPIGIISPVIIKAKIIMQQLWTLKINWDDPVPSNINDEWTEFVNELSYLHEIRIPRKIIPSACIKFDLVAFCDASLKAYGAAIYVRAKDEHNVYTANLVCSKSRVSPLKVLTLPRLELSAALLGARLMDRVSRELNLNITKRYFFTDSMIVLHYLNANANTWQVFVANRVSEIQSLSNIEDWYHIESKANPADNISRGADPQQMDSKLYWNGPEFLSRPSSNWPKNRFRPTIETCSLPEKRKTVMVVSVVPEFILLNKFSSITKLQRVMAYCLRFLFNLRNIKNKRNNALTAKELIEAHNKIIKLVQNQNFLEEFAALKNGEPVAKGSKLSTLDPFIDENGIMRLGGRLRNSPLKFDRKFPILLPSNHHITQLCIKREHISLLHAGATQTLASLKTKYWPLKARNEVRKVIHSCITCFCVSPRLIDQKMGNLPKDRLVPCRPFLKVGLDYFGPIYIKQGGKRSTKIIKAWE